MTNPTAAEGAERVLCGRYRLRSQIGQGGMGVVWLAHDELLDRPVAVKEVVNVGHAGDDLRERLVREARAAARLDHPGVVRIYDIADDDADTSTGGAPWIIMEVLTGNTLQQAIRQDGPLPPRRVAAIGAALVDAIAAAHEAGILHRDIKPANVQLCEDGRVVLTDFGIASMSGDVSLTRTGDIVGSPAYMSPERARGRSLGPASDLFSLGATLYAAVEGETPFERETPVATLTALVTEPARPCARAGDLAPVLDGLLTKEPEERMTAETARAMLVAVSRGEDLPPLLPVASAPASTSPSDNHATQVFEAALDLPSTPSTPMSPPVDDALPLTRPVPPRRRVSRALVVLLLLGVGAAGGAAVWALTRQPHSAANDATPGVADGPFSPGEGSVPADWRVRTGPTGWTLATPTDWEEQNQGSVRRWRRPSPYAYIAVVSTSGSSAEAALTEFTTAFGRTHAAYQQQPAASTTFRGAAAPTVTFTYRADNTDLEASLLAYRPSADSTRVYLLWWQTLPAGWESSQQVRAQVLASFRPA